MHQALGCTIVGLVLLLGVQAAEATSYGGVEFPQGAVSFADKVIDYVAGAQVVSPYTDPTQALGVPNYPSGPGNGHVSLGWGGNLVVQFTDNSLTTSGDTDLDLWIFEVGAAVEPTKVEISTDGASWIDVGDVGGATSGIDLDALIGFGVVLWEKYSFVRLTDNNAHLSGSPWGGADIDAVGAISSAAPAAIVPEPVTVLSLIGGLAGLGRYLRRRVS